ncbi:MAG: hypothetical protein RSB70_00360 [Clostridium sp.]
MSRCCGCDFMPAYSINCGGKKKSKDTNEPVYLIPCNSCGATENVKPCGIGGLNNGFVWLIVLILVILQFGKKDECSERDCEQISRCTCQQRECEQPSRCNCQQRPCKKGAGVFGVENALLFIIVLFFLCGGASFLGGQNNKSC